MQTLGTYFVIPFCETDKLFGKWHPTSMNFCYDPQPMLKSLKKANIESTINKDFQKNGAVDLSFIDTKHWVDALY